MAYNNIKVKARQTVTQSSTQTDKLGTVSEVPMGEWNVDTPYKKLNKVRYVSEGGSGVTLLAKKANQGVEPFVSQGWQEVWMVETYDGGVVSPDGVYPNMTAGNATNAQNDGSGVNIAEQFANISEKIPSTASAENQLADKAFVNSSINNMAAFYITYNSQGNAFPNHASLIAANTFYSGGKVRVPTQNDYAIVLADETQPKGVDGSYPTTRYVYQTANAGGTYPDGQWEFQYVVNNTSLTQAQVDAINSGITKELVDTIGKGNVLSVNGQAGNVTITPSNIGALSIRQIEGNVQNYVNFVVPLIDITNDVIDAERYFDGTICIYRDNGVNRSVVAEAHLKKKYNAVDAYSAFIQFQISHGATHAIVKFSKDGRTYIGARYTEASQVSGNKFVYGKWSNDTEVRGFPIWSYYNMQSNTVLDAEIYNSMVDWVENNITTGALAVRSPLSPALTLHQDNNYSGIRFTFVDGYYSQFENNPNAHGFTYLLRNANGENQIVVDFPETNGTLALKGAIRNNGLEFSYVSPDGYKWVAGLAAFAPTNNGEYTITYKDGFSFSTPTKCIPIVSCWGWYNSSYACQIGITSVGTNNFSFKISGSTIDNITYFVIGLE